MNKDAFAGKWKQVRGESRAWWDRLSDDDLDKVAGRLDIFVDLLQKKYGYSREHAEDEIERHVMKLESDLNRKTQSRKRST
ncbi:MAG TPA: hypothetical protein VHP14_27510 [Anaerolineales bacterium]|nr:hypothetical protein [Anaerolineales bacterium]